MFLDRMLALLRRSSGPDSLQFSSKALRLYQLDHRVGRVLRESPLFVVFARGQFAIR